MKKKHKEHHLKSSSASNKKSKKKIPKGKVILYTYVKPENKAYFEEQAERVGGSSKAMDILLDDLRWKNKQIAARITKGAVAE